MNFQDTRLLFVHYRKLNGLVMKFIKLVMVLSCHLGEQYWD